MRCVEARGAAKTGSEVLEQGRGSARIARSGPKGRAHPWRATAPQRRREKEGEPAANIKADPATVAIVAEVQSPGGA